MYVLAGGNENLRKWGLDEWMGVLRLPFLPDLKPLPARISAYSWLEDGRAPFHASTADWREGGQGEASRLFGSLDAIMAEDRVSGIPPEICKL